MLPGTMSEVKSLVVFYSRSGTTRKVAEKITNLLKSDIEEDIDMKNRAGALGGFISAKDAALKRLTEALEDLYGSKPVASLELKTKEVVKEEYIRKCEAFVKEIDRASTRT